MSFPELIPEISKAIIPQFQKITLVFTKSLIIWAYYDLYTIIRGPEGATNCESEVGQEPSTITITNTTLISK